MATARYSEPSFVRQNAVQATVQTRVVDLAFFDLQQIVQRRRRIPALLDGQFAAWRTQTIDRQQSRHARPRHIGRLVIHRLFEESVQSQPLPQLDPQIAGAELARSLQSHFIQQYARHLRVIGRRLHIRGEQFQLLCFTLLVENLDGLHPPRMGRTIQLAQVAERLLARTVRCTHRFHQRPIRVILAVLAAVVRPQKHSELIVS